MKTYNVKYRRIGKVAWQVLEKVCEDGFCPDHPIRYFMLEGGERVELPALQMEFSFCAERSRLIEEQARAAAEAKAKRGDLDAL